VECFNSEWLSLDGNEPFNLDYYQGNGSIEGNGTVVICSSNSPTIALGRGHDHRWQTFIVSQSGGTNKGRK